MEEEDKGPFQRIFETFKDHEPLFRGLAYMAIILNVGMLVWAIVILVTKIRKLSFKSFHIMMFSMIISSYVVSIAQYSQ